MIQKNKKGFEIMAQYVTITSDKRKMPALLLCILGFVICILYRTR